MNIGILGAGSMGATHARSFAKLPGVRVAAMSSRSAAKASQIAGQVGARAETDDRAIIDDPGIDAISITLPTHLHRSATIAALQAGKQVLLEKPFALTLEDCDVMMSAQRQAGANLMIGHTLRFWPEYVALKRLIDTGALGAPVTATATRLSQKPVWATWYDDPAQSGGTVMDLMIHDYDALNWMLGAPLSVYARGQRAAPGLWTQAMVTVDYGRARGTAEGSHLLPPDYPFTMTLRVVCERGVVDYIGRGAASTLTVHEPGRSYALPFDGDNAYDRQAAYFFECVQRKRQPDQGTPEQARLAVAVALGVRRSLESGRVEQMPAGAGA
jgi:predicted dehydrogenase